jgi:hypothetical protein
MAKYSKSKKNGRLSRKYNNKKYNLSNNKVAGGKDSTSRKSKKSKSLTLTNRDRLQQQSPPRDRPHSRQHLNDVHPQDNINYINPFDITRQPRIITNEPTIINSTQNYLGRRRKYSSPTRHVDDLELKPTDHILRKIYGPDKEL